LNKDIILEKVKDFAAKAHGEQTRKYSPDAYIVHPIRVMEICKQYSPDIALLSAALLHDVLEDTPVTKHQLLDALYELMPETDARRTVKLVVELTDIYVKKDYPSYNRRKRKAMESERMAKTSSESQTVKYADIIDNSREIASHDPDFAKVFLRECKNLLKVMTQGHPELYRQAVEMVDTNLEGMKKVKEG